MKTKLGILGLVLVMLFAVQSYAGQVSGGYSSEIFRVEVGKDYRHYSKSDLQRRVWELERAVFQLQQKVFEIEMAGAAAPVQTWSCSVTALGNPYVATGETKAVATANVMDACKAGNKGDGFHCKQIKCEQ
jgi:hypothetical protein